MFFNLAFYLLLCISIALGQRFTTFYIRARTDSVGLVFDSAPDSGYSVDNLAPSLPMGLSATGTGGGAVVIRRIDGAR